MDHLPIILTLELAVIQKDDIPHSNWQEEFQQMAKIVTRAIMSTTKPVYLWQNPAHTPNDGNPPDARSPRPSMPMEHKTLVTNWGGVTSDSEKTQAVYWEFLQRPEEDKVKVQGTRSKYDQGFSLKDKSKRYPRE
ncbi:hypothetical protein BDR07DRAFT_1500199 [Suillus spraguei]|nr:hypothetical protein BDR07DRAFT_1502031 [Suillus spraguei]KAG2351736.1 hypothetical protein BDR07DRAFT_1500500 [Suillus spraguei]KAG2351817.1 hypothetical protein BDR07DRAFT_1500199 [Suillus spraguei]